MPALSNFEAAILGVVEGLTEFIPVSSTGHLILTSHWLGLKGEAVNTFEIFIQLGAILAVVFLYWRRFLSLFHISKSQCAEIGTAASFEGLHGIAKLSLAALPIFVLGGLFGSTIKRELFNPTTVALALIVGGLLMVIVERSNPKSRVQRVEEITLKQALLIGLFQCFALWPGMSRAGSTIVGSMLMGLERRVAAEFSFLVAVPVMCVATTADLYKNLHVLTSADIPAFAIGFVVSFLVALAAVKMFISLLGKMTLIPFAVYRIAVGVLVLALL